MLHLRLSLRLGVRAAEQWQSRAPLIGAHVRLVSENREETVDGANQWADPCCPVAPWSRAPQASNHSPSARPLLPFGVAAFPLWASGGGRSFSSSSASASIDGAVMGAAGVASGGSEVAAIADLSWPPIQAIQYFLEMVHHSTGLPWWATIALTTITARASLFPITLYQMRSTARMSEARPEMERVSNDFKDNPGDPQAMARYQRDMKAVMNKYDVNPFKTMAGGFAQAPLFIGFFLGIRRMAENIPSFKEGGILWFTDLSGADPLYLLPTICAATFLITVEVGAMEGMQGQPMAKNLKMGMRLLGLAMVPLTMSFEKALFCYWIPSNIFSLVQSAVLKQASVKAALGIPIAKEPAQTPMPTISEWPQAGLSSTTTSLPAPKPLSSTLATPQLPSRPLVGKRRRNKRK